MDVNLWSFFFVFLAGWVLGVISTLLFGWVLSRKQKEKAELQTIFARICQEHASKVKTQEEADSILPQLWQQAKKEYADGQ